MSKTLIGKDLNDLERVVSKHGEPLYRARQLYEALYRRQTTTLENISSLPTRLRTALVANCPLGVPKITKRFQSLDGTVRYLLTLEDGKTIESVFIPEVKRDTLCISTQVGCPVDCRFCLTGLMGLERNLTTGEIVGQVIVLLQQQKIKSPDRITNIVMMGMGEPLLNLKAVLKASKLLSDPKGIGVPSRRITVSTSGIPPKIKEFGQFPERPRLAISLNASTERVRRSLMPITHKYSLQELLETCRNYPLRPRERLTFEYVLLSDVNDSDQDARRVVGFLSPIKCRVNLIPFNPGLGIPYEAPSAERIDAFRALLQKSLPCFVRKPRGREIFAACGQLKRINS